jgi:hypothetical protein
MAIGSSGIPASVIAAAAIAQSGDPNVTANNSPRLFYEVERSMMLDPIGTIGRLFPVHVLGASVASNVATFKPQRACIPLRLCVPKAQGTSGAVVQQLQVALEPLYTVSTAEPSANFAETESEMSWLPPMICDVGQQITFNSNSNLVSAGLWVAEITQPPIGAPNSFLARAPFSGVSIGTTSTVTITVSPQKRMRLRRLAFDVQGNAHPTTLSACTISAINCGVEPQLDSVDPVPLAMFDSQVLFGYLDGDIVTPGQSFTITVTNPDGAQALTGVGGVILGDLV